LIRSSARLALPLCAAIICLACSAPLDLGSDLLWTAEHESGDLSEWTADYSEAITLSKSDTAAVSSEDAHRGHFAVKLVNATLDRGEDDPQGPELSHALTTERDAYYSAWFSLPAGQTLTSNLIVLRLRSRSATEPTLFDGEEVQLRGAPDGRFVVSVFSHNPAFLRAPIANPAPLVSAGIWFQLELRYEPQSAGRLRVWLDGVMIYDLSERPGAPGDELVLSVGGATEEAVKTPFVVFVDDAAVSLAQVAPNGRLAD
jgi:hypothetical protein